MSNWWLTKERNAEDHWLRQNGDWWLTSDSPDTQTLEGLLQWEPWELWDAAAGITFRDSPNASCPNTWQGQVGSRVIQHYDAGEVYGTSVRDPSGEFGGEPVLSFYQNPTGALEYLEAASAADWKFLHDGSTEWTLIVPLIIDSTSASGEFFDTSNGGVGPGLRWRWRTDQRFDIYVYNDSADRGRLLGTASDVPHSTRLVCVLAYDSVADNLILRVNGAETNQSQSGDQSSADPPIAFRVSENNPTPKFEFPFIFVSKQKYTPGQMAALESYIDDTYS